MAYFPNGTSGLDYEDRYCRRCLHGDGRSAGQCVVWLAHLDRNYDECNKKDSILHMLIPMSKDGLSNLKCLMFVDREWKPHRKRDPKLQLVLGAEEKEA